MNIGIVGATGRNAKAWAKACRAQGLDVRVLSRTPRPFTTDAYLDLDDPKSFPTAIDGLNVLALITPSGPSQVEREIGLISAASKGRLERIVKLSVVGADLKTPASAFGALHGAIERVLKEADVPYVLLRPNFFMQGVLSPLFRDAGSFLEPIGQAAISYVDIADIAAVAATVAKGGYDYRDLAITGPRALNGFEVAAALTESTGVRTAYANVSLSTFAEHLRRGSVPEWHADALLALYRNVQSGHAAKLDDVSDCVKQVLGRPATDIREFLQTSSPQDGASHQRPQFAGQERS